MAGAITSPVSAMAASKVVRASRLLSKNITNPAGYVPSVSPADAPAFLRCPSDIEKSRWAAGRPWSYHRRVCVQALNSLRLIDLVPRIRGGHPQAAIESVFVIDGDQEQVLASRTPGPGAAFRSHSPA